MDWSWIVIMDWSWIDGERSCKTMQTYMKDCSNNHDSQWCTKGSKGVCTAWLAPSPCVSRRHGHSPVITRILTAMGLSWFVCTWHKQKKLVDHRFILHRVVSVFSQYIYPPNSNWLLWSCVPCVHEIPHFCTNLQTGTHLYLLWFCPAYHYRTKQVENHHIVNTHPSSQSSHRKRRSWGKRCPSDKVQSSWVIPTMVIYV